MIKSSKKSNKRKNIKSKIKNNSNSNNINTLLKKLIQIETKQEKFMKELLDIFKSGCTTIKTPEPNKEEKQPVKLENIKDDIKEVPEIKSKENGLAKVEREIFLDIPSLKIKDKFDLEEEVKEKVKNFEEKKRKIGLFGRKKELDKKAKLKKLVLDNLKKLSRVDDERKQIIGISYILRQFLEVKFKISQTLTYSEMLEELKSREIETNLRLHLIDFFNKLPKEVYSGEKINISIDFCFNLANQTLQELSQYDKINKIVKK